MDDVARAQALFLLREVADANWQVLIDLIYEHIQKAKDEAYEAVGKIPDFERGKGAGLEEFLNALEAEIETGRGFIEDDEQSRS